MAIVIPSNINYCEYKKKGSSSTTNIDVILYKSNSGATAVEKFNRTQLYGIKNLSATIRQNITTQDWEVVVSCYALSLTDVKLGANVEMEILQGTSVTHITLGIYAVKPSSSTGRAYSTFTLNSAQNKDVSITAKMKLSGYTDSPSSNIVTSGWEAETTTTTEG